MKRLRIYEWKGHFQCNTTTHVGNQCASVSAAIQALKAASSLIIFNVNTRDRRLAAASIDDNAKNYVTRLRSPQSFTFTSTVRFG